MVDLKNIKKKNTLINISILVIINCYNYDVSNALIRQIYYIKKFLGFYFTPLEAFYLSP